MNRRSPVRSSPARARLFGGLVLTLLLPLAGCEIDPDGQDADATDTAPPTREMDVAELRMQIQTANDEATRLLGEGDTRGFVETTYTEDAIILPPGGPRIQGREGIAEFWTQAGQDMGIESVALTTVEVEALGPDRAWEIGRWVIGTAGGEATGKYLVIWQRDADGTWRWDVDIWNEGDGGLDGAGMEGSGSDTAGTVADDSM